MLCDDCGKNQATYHEIRKINGRTTQVHLCEQCRRKHGYDVLPLSGMGDILGSFNEFFGTPNIENDTCEYCGTNLNDFLSTGYLGCEHCYDRFSRSILPQLKQMQRKVPARRTVNPSASMRALKPSWTKPSRRKITKRRAE